MAATAVMLTSGASGRVNALFSVQVWRSLLMLINAFIMLFFVPFRGRKRSVSAVEPPLKDEKQEVAAGSSSGGGSRKGGPVVRVPTKRWKSSAAVVAAVDQEVAARRALAIRRVMQSKDEDSIREFSLFATPRGETLFTQSWRPVSNEIRGIVVVLHGLNEHGDRYTEFAKELNANSFKVYAMDWIGLRSNADSGNGIYKDSHYTIVKGHGGSDGLHAYVHSLDVAVSDTVSFIKKVVAENPGLPCFCFGHSTGGAIVLKAVMDPKIEASVSGVVLTSPAVGVQPSHPIFAVLAPVCSFLFPRYQFRAANKQGMVVSRDPKALLAKYSDPLVYTGSIRIRTGYEILRISTYLQENVKQVKVPFLVLHGTADTITDPMGSKRLYEEASSSDKSIKMFDGFLHDLLFEPERDMVSQEIVDWLKSRV